MPNSSDNNDPKNDRISSNTNDTLKDNEKAAPARAPQQSTGLLIDNPDLKTLHLLKLLGDHVWDWNLTTNEMAFSAKFPTLLGYAEEVFSHRIDEWFRLIHPSDIKVALEKMRSCVEGEQKKFEDEYRLERQDGSWQWVRVRGAIIARTNKGRAARLQGLIRMIDPPQTIVLAANNAATSVATVESVSSVEVDVVVDVDSEVDVDSINAQQQTRETSTENNNSTNNNIVVSVSDNDPSPTLSNFSHQLTNIVFFQLQRFPGGRCCFPYASGAVEHLHGVTVAEIENNAEVLFDKVHVDDIAEVRHQMKESALSLQMWNLHYRVLSAKGEKHLSGVAFPHRQLDDSVIWHGYLVDGSDHYAKQRQAQSLKQHLQTLLALDNIGSFDINVQNGIIYFSQGIAELLKIAPEYLDRHQEFWTFFWNDCIHPDDIPHFKQAYYEHFISYGRKPYQAQFRVRSTDGAWHFVCTVGSVVEWSGQGKALRMVGTYIDVTERTKQETERRHLEDLLRSGRDRYKHLATELELLLTHTPVGIMLVHNGKILRANTTLAQLFGYKNAKQMLGVSILDLHPSEQSYQTMNDGMRARLKQERFADVQSILKKTDGSVFNARLTARILPLEQFSGASVWVIEEWQTAPLVN